MTASDFVIEHRDAMPYLGIRRPTPDGVPPVADSAFPELFARLAEREVAPAGPIIVRVHSLGADEMPSEITVAVPVEPGSEGDDLVEAGELPAGRYIRALHSGPYNHDDLSDILDTRESLLSWAASESPEVSRPAGEGREFPCAADHFLVGPDEEEDFTRWRTEITYLILE